MLANAGFAVTIPIAGGLSDRIGRRAVMLTGTVIILVLALPLLNVLQNEQTSLTAKGFGSAAAGAAVGLVAGPGPAMLSEMFPTSVRYTGLGLAYSLSNAVFSLRRSDHHVVDQGNVQSRYSGLLRDGNVRRQRDRLEYLARECPQAGTRRLTAVLPNAETMRVRDIS